MLKEVKTKITYDSYKTNLLIQIQCQGSVLGIDSKLHSVVLPLLSPLGRSQNRQVQLGPIEVMVGMLMNQWWIGIVPFNTQEMPLQMPEAHRELHCLGIDGNADDWAVVSVSALYGASAAAYAGKSSLRM